MTIEIKRVVTTRTSDGASVIAELGTPRQEAAAGMDIVNVWGTSDGRATVTAGDQPEPVLAPFFPGAGGTRMCIVRWPPMDAESVEDDTSDPEESQPGLLDPFEQDNPGMHTTDSVDYGICLAGEIYLEVDGGVEELVTPGTIVVQRGTRHAWRNRSNEICTMAYVLVGADRV